MKLIIYIAFLQPFMNYCCFILGSTAKKKKNFSRRKKKPNKQYFNHAKKKLRMVSKLDHETNSSMMYGKSKALKVDKVFQMQNLIFLFKYISDQLLWAFDNNMYRLQNEVSTKTTRNHAILPSSWQTQCHIKLCTISSASMSQKLYHYQKVNWRGISTKHLNNNDLPSGTVWYYSFPSFSPLLSIIMLP